MLLPFLKKDRIEAGCDEAGRGCLAGPVFAAAVILPQEFRNDLLNDSKKLTAKQRYNLRPVIEKEAIAWAVGIASTTEIDRINILNASFLAMHRALAQLKIRPEHLLIDGNRFRSLKQIPFERLKIPRKFFFTENNISLFPDTDQNPLNPFSPSTTNINTKNILFFPKNYPDFPFDCIIKGDGKIMSIAAASILAKTYRDDFMKKIHQQFPCYNWDKNKGYPTMAHRKAIEENGITIYHRKSYKLLQKDLQLCLFQ